MECSRDAVISFCFAFSMIIHEIGNYCILYQILIIDRLFLQNQSFLNENATKAGKDLLPESEGNLYSVCWWPDEIKWMNKWQWTSELHYVDTPDFRCNYDYDSKLTNL